MEALPSDLKAIQVCVCVRARVRARAHLCLMYTLRTKILGSKTLPPSEDLDKWPVQPASFWRPHIYPL